MHLQNFNSLFEIFATFTIAYVIIDELTENPFVRLISERVLRKGKKIKSIYFNITTILSGCKASIKYISSLNLDDRRVKTGIPKMIALVDNAEIRCEQSFTELKSSIRENYSTKVFVYLNSYLFLYCLSVLYLSGLYSDENCSHNKFLNTSLFVLNAGSIIVLIFGWFVDTKKKSSYKSSHKKIYNGYLCMSVAFLVIVVLAIICYYMHLEILPDNALIKNILFQITVFLPISNFVIYFFKAAKRAGNTLPKLEERAMSFEGNLRLEIKKVKDFLGMCDYLRSEDFLVADSVLEK